MSSVEDHGEEDEDEHGHLMNKCSAFLPVGLACLLGWLNAESSAVAFLGKR